MRVRPVACFMVFCSILIPKYIAFLSPTICDAVSSVVPFMASPSNLNPRWTLIYTNRCSLRR